MYSSSLYQPSTLSSYLYANSSSPFETKYSTVGPSMSSYLTETINNSDGTTTHRPYVSAIRKRRTLFSDDFDGPGSNESTPNGGLFHDSYNHAYYNHYEPPPPTQPTQTIPTRTEPSETTKPNGFGFSHARNRPLSVVNEDASALAAAAAAAAAAASSSNGVNHREQVVTLNRSLTFNDSQFGKSSSQQQRGADNGENGKIGTTKSGLKKSNSVSSPKSDSSSSSNGVVTSKPPCNRATVFDRLANNSDR